MDPLESEQAGDVTLLLHRVSAGDRAAEQDLYVRIQSELRRLATARLRGERARHTLQPTALVNEAYIRLVKNEGIEWKGRTHFLALAAQSMRRILADYARSRNAQKRGGGIVPLSIDIDGTNQIEAAQSDMFANLDDALDKLAELQPDWAKIVEMRFYGGLTEDQIAEIENCSTRTVKRKWEKARAWLKGEIGN